MIINQPKTIQICVQKFFIYQQQINLNYINKKVQISSLIKINLALKINQFKMKNKTKNFYQFMILYKYQNK